MRRIGLNVAPPARIMLYTILAISWLTGLGFFLLDTFFQVEGDFGSQKHFLQNPALVIHGAMAFLIMICFGGLLFAHVPLGWRTGRIRALGISLISIISVQIISAYLLYYLSHEGIREFSQWLHLINGIILPVVMTIHITQGRKAMDNKS